MKEKATIILSLIIARIGTILIILIAIIGIGKACFEKRKDPIDNSFLTAQRVVDDDVLVVDSTFNGFRLVYVTKNQVTVERVTEIRSRQHIKYGLKKLANEAPKHFGSLIETDIYDFAGYAKKYDPDPDIEIHNIFIYGNEKIKLYEAPNPKIKNPAKYISKLSLQGVQYLKRNDVYNTIKKEDRIYRYWKCRGIHSFSKTDERFIHFSEDDRLD